MAYKGTQRKSLVGTEYSGYPNGAGGDDECITIVDLEAYEACSDLSSVSFAVPVYLPTIAPKKIPGFSAKVQFSGEWPSLKQIVLIKGRLLAAQDGGYLFLAERITDSAANLLLERVR